MPKPEIIRRQSILYITIGYFGSVALVLPSLLRSGFLRIFGEDCIQLVCLYYLVLLLVTFVCKNKASILLAMAAVSLAIANVSQPLMNFVCHMDSEASDQMHRLLNISYIHLATLLITWLFLALLDNLMQKHCRIEGVLAAVCCLVPVSLVFLRGGADTNTSTIAGVQPAILMFFLIMVCFVVALGKQGRISRLLHIILCASMLLVLIYRHELGIPILCGLSCFLFYLLIYPTPKLYILLGCFGIAVVGIVVVFCMNNELLQDTLNKILTRTSDSAQLQSVMQTLQSAGWFGNYAYTVRVPAASTDFALANSIHYAGYLWALLTGLLLLIGAYRVLKEESSPHGFQPSTLLRGLSTIGICVIVFYNIMQSIRLAPMIGVQCFFCGTSYSFAFLSAAILGCITYRQDTITQVTTSLKCAASRWYAQ